MPDTARGPNGKQVKVTAAGEYQVQGVIADEMHHQNEHEGEAWTMPFDARDPTSDNDIFGYIQNTADDRDLHVRHFDFHSTVAGFLEIIRVTGTPSSGSAVTLTNENHNFSLDTPEGVFEAGNDITALVDGGKHNFMYLRADVQESLTISHDIVLGKNDAIALNWVPNTGILTGTVKFFTARPSEE